MPDPAMDESSKPLIEASRQAEAEEAEAPEAHGDALLASAVPEAPPAPADLVAPSDDEVVQRPRLSPRTTPRGDKVRDLLREDRDGARSGGRIMLMACWFLVGFVICVFVMQIPGVFYTTHKDFKVLGNDVKTAGENVTHVAASTSSVVASSLRNTSSSVASSVQNFSSGVATNVENVSSVVATHIEHGSSALAERAKELSSSVATNVAKDSTVVAAGAKELSSTVAANAAKDSTVVAAGAKELSSTVARNVAKHSTVVAAGVKNLSSTVATNVAKDSTVMAAGAKELSSTVARNVAKDSTVVAAGIKNLSATVATNVAKDSTVVAAGAKELSSTAAKNVAKDSTVVAAGVKNLSSTVATNVAKDSTVVAAGVKNLSSTVATNVAKDSTLVAAGAKGLSSTVAKNVAKDSTVVAAGVKNRSSTVATNVAKDSQAVAGNVENFSSGVAQNVEHESHQSGLAKVASEVVGGLQSASQVISHQVVQASTQLARGSQGALQAAQHLSLRGVQEVQTVLHLKQGQSAGQEGQDHGEDHGEDHSHEGHGPGSYGHVHEGHEGHGHEGHGHEGHAHGRHGHGRHGHFRHSTSPPSTTAVQGDLLLVTLQTEGLSLVERVGFPTKIYNIGMGQPWRGYDTKFQLLLPFLERQSENDLLAFVDGSDVFWGGCDLEHFLTAYHRLVAISQAPIIVSAETACGEQPCRRIPPVPDWATEMAHRDLNGGFWSKYLSKEGCLSDCFCTHPPSVKFLNSGFFMGPVRDLKHLVSWALQNYANVSTLGDQSVIAAYWLQHPHRITLDYTGELCLTTSDLDTYKLFFKSIKTGHVWNRAFGRVQCLIHGNGRGRDEMWEMLRLYSHSPHGRRYRAALESEREIE